MASVAAWLTLSGPVSAVPLPLGVDVVLRGTSQAERPEIGPPPGTDRTAGFALVDPVAGEIRLRGVVGMSLSAHESAGRVWVNHRIESFEDLAGAGYRVEALVTAPVWGDSVQPVDADFRIDAPGVTAPAHARHDLDTAFMQVVFGFGQPLRPGQDSRWMFVLGDDLATFGRYGAFVIVADAAGQRYELPFDSYVTFVPEPTTAWLAACGLGLLGGAILRFAGRGAQLAPVANHAGALALGTSADAWREAAGSSFPGH